MIDLHVHSTASDGSFSPAEIVREASAKRLKAVALTDHDTVDGLQEFLDAGTNYPNIELIPGIELAAMEEQEAHQNCHIVGLFLEHISERLQRMMRDMVQWRNERNLRMLGKLADLGMPLTMEEVQKFSEGGVIGRPHIACAMVAKGYVSSFASAFERFLASGKKAYDGRHLPNCSDVIATIHSCGGVAIWAHPFTRGNYTRNKVRKIALVMKGMGLDGIEAYYALHTPTQCQNIVDIAKELDLLPSGGSDFHGSRFKRLNLGIGYGNLVVPDNILPQIRQKAEDIRRLHCR